MAMPAPIPAVKISAARSVHILMPRLGTRSATAHLRARSLAVIGRARFSTQSVQSPGWAVSEAGLAAAQPRLTHEVLNQAAPLADYNAFSCDASLRQIVEHGGASWANEQLHSFGAQTGSAAWQELSREANANAPRLLTHDRHGRRVDTVQYHASYHQLMSLGIENGVSAFAWGEHAGRQGVHTARSALNYMMYQLECGVGCPMTMTFAAVPALACTPSVGEAWLPALTAGRYDGRDVPLHEKAPRTPTSPNAAGHRPPSSSGSDHLPHGRRAGPSACR